MEINLFKKIKTNCLTNNDINTQMFLNNLYCLKSVKSNNIIFNFENIDKDTIYYSLFEDTNLESYEPNKFNKRKYNFINRK